jgi:nucleotide-binding universal stress UspA family protein
MNVALAPHSVAAMKTVIAGFDGSDQGADALALGASIAKTFEARLIVACAVDFAPLEIAGPHGAQSSSERLAEMLDRAALLLGDDPFEWHEIYDNPAAGLRRLAETQNADVIVIGVTHRGPWGRAVPGTVASKLFDGSPCGVLVAPHGWRERDHYGLGLIGVGFDGHGESAVALRQGEELARVLDATLRVIAVAPSEPAGAATAGTQDSRSAWTIALKDATHSIIDEVEVERVLRWGDPAAELALEGVELDLLVVGSRGHGPLGEALLGSVSSELVRTAPCPVLVMPRGAAVSAEPELPDYAFGPNPEVSL